VSKPSVAKPIPTKKCDEPNPLQKTENNRKQQKSRYPEFSALELLPSVLLQLCMQGLDLVSLAQLSCTNHGIAAAALHKESGRFLIQKATRDEEFDRHNLEWYESRYDSSVFRAHIPVTASLDVWSSKDHD